jgi:hypothetical protein
MSLRHRPPNAEHGSATAAGDAAVVPGVPGVLYAQQEPERWSVNQTQMNLIDIANFGQIPDGSQISVLTIYEQHWQNESLSPPS